MEDIFFIISVLIANIIDLILLMDRVKFLKIIFFSIFLSLLGLIDDLFLINSKIRYLIQIIIFLIVNSVHPFLLSEQIFIILLPIIFFGTVIINFINFIDGIDGILIGCSIPILIFSQINSFEIQIFTALAGIIAFLRWNWDPSKIFMGDCGSNFLGALIFYCTLSKGEYIINFKTIFYNPSNIYRLLVLHNKKIS